MCGVMIHAAANEAESVQKNPAGVEEEMKFVPTNKCGV